MARDAMMSSEVVQHLQEWVQQGVDEALKTSTGKEIRALPVIGSLKALQVENAALRAQLAILKHVDDEEIDRLYERIGYLELQLAKQISLTEELKTGALTKNSLDLTSSQKTDSKTQKRGLEHDASNIPEKQDQPSKRAKIGDSHGSLIGEALNHDAEIEATLNPEQPRENPKDTTKDERKKLVQTLQEKSTDTEKDSKSSEREAGFTGLENKDKDLDPTDLSDQSLAIVSTQEAGALSLVEPKTSHELLAVGKMIPFLTRLMQHEPRINQMLDIFDKQADQKNKPKQHKSISTQGQAPPSNELNDKDPAQNLDSAPPPLSRSQKKALRKAGITEGLSTPGGVNAQDSMQKTLHDFSFNASSLQNSQNSTQGQEDHPPGFPSTLKADLLKPQNTQGQPSLAAEQFLNNLSSSPTGGLTNLQSPNQVETQNQASLASPHHVRGLNSQPGFGSPLTPNLPAPTQTQNQPIPNFGYGSTSNTPQPFRFTLQPRPDTTQGGKLLEQKASPIFSPARDNKSTQIFSQNPIPQAPGSNTIRTGNVSGNRFGGGFPPQKNLWDIASERYEPTTPPPENLLGPPLAALDKIVTSGEISSTWRSSDYRCELCCMGFPSELRLLRHLKDIEHIKFAEDIWSFTFGKEYPSCKPLPPEVRKNLVSCFPRQNRRTLLPSTANRLAQVWHCQVCDKWLKCQDYVQHQWVRAHQTRVSQETRAIQSR